MHPGGLVPVPTGELTDQIDTELMTLSGSDCVAAFHGGVGYGRETANRGRSDSRSL